MKVLSSLLVLSLLCVGVGVASAQTTSQILTGNWQVNPNAAITCDPTTCCCFNGAVNGYVKNNDNYLNGTALGVCRKATQSDNLDPPAGYTWSAEFLGIDNAAFTLANLTINGTLGISLTMNTSAVASSHQKCGFQLWQANPAGLPATPTPPTTPTPTTSAFVTQFAGTWYADGTTCATSDTTCCCFTNTVTVSMNQQVSTYTINGTASTGCGAPTESDDFPWPVDANSANVGYTAPSFLPLADNYTVDYTAGTGGNPSTIFFKDLTRPACSIKLLSSPPSSATTSPPTGTSNTTTSPPTTHSEAAGQATCVLAIAVAFAAVLLH